MARDSRSAFPAILDLTPGAGAVRPRARPLRYPYQRVVHRVRTASFFSFLCVAAALAFLSIRLLRFIDAYAVNLFFWDQWSFYGGLFLERPLPDLFLWQHGAHRMGLGYVLLWLMAPLSRWDARFDAFLIGGILILATLAALLLKYKLTHQLSWTDSIIPVTYLTLYQYDIFLGAANVSAQALPLLLITVFCNALLIRSLVYRYTMVLFINFLAVFTGYGFFAGLITPIIILIDIVGDPSHRRLKCFALLVSVLTLACFFVGYTYNRSIDCFTFPHPYLVDYVSFSALMYNSFFGLRGYGLLTPIFPAVLLVSYAVNATRVHSERPISYRTVTVVLLSFSFLFTINSAIGRVCAGVEMAYSSRYTTFVIPAILALYLTFINVKRPRVGKLLSIVLLGFIGYSQIANASLLDKARTHMRHMVEWQSCYLRSHDIAKCNGRAGEIYWNQDDLKYKLDYLESHRLNLFKDTPGST